MKDIKPILAVGVLTLGFGYFYLTFIMGKQPNDQVLIAIVSAVGTVLGFYFGSSSSGAKKDETINNLTYIKKKMAKYEVAEIEENKALLYAENNQEAFKCELNGKFYTYTDIDVDAPVVQIEDAENDEMFLIEWNGTTPVFSRRKMFPR